MQAGIFQWSSGGRFTPQSVSTAAIPSSLALCARSGGWATSPIAERVGNRRPEVCIHGDETPGIGLKAHRIQPEIARARSAPDRHQHLLRLELLARSTPGNAEPHAAIGALGFLEPSAEPDLDFFPAKLALKDLGNLRVGARQHLVRHLQHDDVRAHRVNVGELHTHGTRADDHEPSGNRPRFERLARTQDVLAIQRDARGHPLPRAGGEQNVLASTTLCSAPDTSTRVAPERRPRPRTSVILFLRNRLSTPLLRRSAVFRLCVISLS